MEPEIIKIVVMSSFIFVALWLTIKTLYNFLLSSKVTLTEYIIDVGFCFWTFIWVFSSFWYYFIYANPQFPTTLWQIVVVFWVLVIPFLMSFIKSRLFDAFGLRKIKYFYGSHYIFVYILLPISYTIAQIVSYYM